MSERVMTAPAAGRSTPSRVGFWLLTTLFLASLYTPALLYAGDNYWLPLFSRWLALAMFALSVDLVWGYTGLLSLGQGLYFGLGGYVMAYYLAFQKAATDNLNGIPGKSMPDFMYRCQLTRVPPWLSPLAELPVALLMILFLPTMVAALFGLVVWTNFFKWPLLLFPPRTRRWLANLYGMFLVRCPKWVAKRLNFSGVRTPIKGVFFSLVTQALVLAVYLLVENQQAYTGGVVGMPYLPWLTLLGFKFSYLSMFFLIATTLALSFLACLWLTNSRFGRVLTAIRDNETRVLALGYSTAMYKTFIFAAAGLIAGIAGALYVAEEHTVGARDTFGIAFSIEVVILVAVGGRGTLFGPVLGTVLVLLGKTYANNEFKQVWPLMLAGLFIGVVVFLPEGIVGWLREAPARAARLLRRARIGNPVAVPVG